MTQEYSEIIVDVTRFTVQYMLKDKTTGMPTMCPVRSYSASLSVGVPSDLVAFIPLYVDGVSHRDSSREDYNPNYIPSYAASREAVKKWKAEIKKRFPDAFDVDDPKMLTPDYIIDCAISCTMEDELKDSLDTLWDEVLAGQLNAVPEVPEDKELGDRFIHIISWDIHKETTKK